ncbi:tRNA A22 N-methylase [Pseudomonas sp. YL-218 TE3947]
MNEQALSMRPERVAAHVPAGARLAGIGSDHGYLPVALMRRGAIAAAVAGEVALTPLRSAERTVCLANGLAAIEPEDGITAVSICCAGTTPASSIPRATKSATTVNSTLPLPCCKTPMSAP